jgi:AraC-like DNA-binding protein/ligand-binding sensor protein
VHVLLTAARILPERAGRFEAENNVPHCATHAGRPFITFVMMDSGETLARRSRMIVEQLAHTEVFRDYQRAFQETTGLPLSLRPVETFDLAFRDSPHESPFCALMSSARQTCAACRQLQRRVEEAAGEMPQTLRCYAGWYESVVPIRVGDELIAILRTGQILLQRPGRGEFSQLREQLVAWRAEVDLAQAEAAYFQGRILTKPQYESILRLLGIFAQHLASLGKQLMVQEAKAESPQIAKAKGFITEHQAEDLSLSEVARAVNMSAFYFCKVFKQATGLTFTDYLARIRVEKVKHLLLDPNRRISEAAFAAGFQSLSQFNRIFRKIAGEAPTAYRERVRRIAAA